jgi:uncharacterized protein (DUF2062 family)
MKKDTAIAFSVGLAASAIMALNPFGLTTVKLYLACFFTGLIVTSVVSRWLHARRWKRYGKW